MKGFLVSFAVSFSIIILIVACGGVKTGTFFYGSLGLGDSILYVVNADTAAPAALTVTAYDMQGNFLRVIGDYTQEGSAPRGIVPLDLFHLLIAFDGTDRIESLEVFGTTTQWASNVQFTGNIFQMTKDSNGNVLVIETNTIEKFDSLGDRVPVSGATPYISTTVGSCVLSTPRGVAINSNGQLVVVNSANEDIDVYNISADPATCVNVNSSLAATSGLKAVLAHSNGKLYIADEGTAASATALDVIYETNATASSGLTTLLTNNSIFWDPTALAEMPDGTILIASDGTDSIERITTSGQRVGSSSFIKNAFTGSVTQMVIVRGQ